MGSNGISPIIGFYIVRKSVELYTSNFGVCFLVSTASGALYPKLLDGSNAWWLIKGAIP